VLLLLDAQLRLAFLRLVGGKTVINGAAKELA